MQHGSITRDGSPGEAGDVVNPTLLDGYERWRVSVLALSSGIAGSLFDTAWLQLFTVVHSSQYFAVETTSCLSWWVIIVTLVLTTSCLAAVSHMF